MTTQRPAPRRRRLSAEDRRRRILQAAMAVFAQRGYHAASMAEIAADAGIAASVIYDHFPSKADLHVALLEGQAAELLQSTQAAVAAAPAGLAPRVRAGADAFFAFVERHPYAWRMLFRDPPGEPSVAACHDRIHQQATDAIVAFLKSHAPSAHGRPEGDRAIEMFAQMLKMAQHGLAVWWYEHRDTPRDELVDRLLDFCWTGLQRHLPPPTDTAPR
ncbi:TetR/AcrR family transcriptional regulator [Nonomuraea endophytica]|uniref:AcrR family transcriptional regulator n=1 Tax=Nonomuraea endophytica TaxID=714136 RepID=A0A7W8EEU8_9ACTN|nr:TetR/AcrR family transcriptional regulator [Nonomuraea endophytica]MBB5075792.1 AcrR family transcriptional regulator [Nonomuraea endophytica]